MPIRLPTWSIDEDVYQGFWVDRSLEGTHSARLTLDRQAGGLVIAFLALFVAATARNVWKIMRFLLHATLSSSSSQGTYHQRQAILRNQPLARDALMDLLRLAYVWHDKVHRGQYTTLPIALIACLISAASIAAGLLSSKILTASDNIVLIAGHGCGSTMNDSMSSLNLGLVMQYQSQRCVDAFTYAVQCYRNDHISLTKACDSFAVSRLTYTSDRNASCPFGHDVCKSSFGNILLDSGALDSIQDLGLNSGPHFNVRHTTHCAPLMTIGFTETFKDSNTSQETQTYRYGSRGNKTHVYEVELGKKPPIFDAITTANYNVLVLGHSEIDPNLKPIQQLSLSNGSLSLLFLDASNIVYYNSTEDPWFSATTPASSSLSPESEARRRFVADEPVGVMGCAVRRFYCNPALPEATTCVDGFAEYNQTQGTISQIWPDAREQAEMRAIMSALSNRGVGYLDVYYAIPSVPTLLARNTILGNMQTASLPIDHWKDEREYLFQASLADMQSAVVEHARGLDLGQGIFCNNATSCYRNCKSQKIRSSGHYSFSAWALGTVFIVGCILILISTFAEKLLSFLIRVPKFQTGKLIYHLAEWQAGSTLQLQRIAHESLGLGHWARTDEAIPVTLPGELLGVLDITNTKHALLIAQGEELNVLGPVDAVVSIKTPSSRYSRLPSIENL